MTPLEKTEVSLRYTKRATLLLNISSFNLAVVAGMFVVVAVTVWRGAHELIILLPLMVSLNDWVHARNMVAIRKCMYRARKILEEVTDEINS